MPFRLFTLRIFLAALLLTLSASAQMQEQNAPAAPSQDALVALQSSLARVNTAVSEVRVSRWKVSKSLRASTLEDVSSIQQDLNGALPALIDKAISAQSSCAPSFAVYRNVDALYDVLLRISALANVAASAKDARMLEDTRAGLESSRSRLANALLQAATEQDAQLAAIRSQPAASAAARAAPTKVIVVDDGPDTRSKRRRRKTAPKPTQPPPPAQTP